MARALEILTQLFYCLFKQGLFRAGGKEICKRVSFGVTKESAAAQAVGAGLQGKKPCGRHDIYRGKAGCGSHQ